MMTRFVRTCRKRTLGLRNSLITGFVIAGLAGGLAACSSGGTPNGPSTAATTRLNAQPVAELETAAVPATADTWVAQNQPTKNFGAGKTITVHARRESGLLRFTIPQRPGWTVASARLKLNSGNVAGRGISVYSTTSAWSESQVSWNTAPPGGVLLATGDRYQRADWASWNVMPAVPSAGGTVNLRIENPAQSSATFLTRESGSATAPQLVITRAAVPGTVPTATPSADRPTWAPPPAPTKSMSSAGRSAARTASHHNQNGPTSTPGWTQIYRDDFTGTSLGAGWGEYAGAIPSTPGGVWSRSMVQVTDGKLRLNTSKVNGVWTSGGVMNSSSARTTYGKYEVRFRMAKANGVKYALLLWPASKQWPMDGEIDFAEDGGGARTTTSGTLHWGTTSNHQQAQRHARADFSHWHTVGVEWTPGKVTFTLDGAPYGTIQSSHAPTKPMDLALQAEAGSCGHWMTCTDSTTPAWTALEIDWVAVYTRS